MAPPDQPWPAGVEGDSEEGPAGERRTTVAPAARQPRAGILLNGERLPYAPIDLTVVNNAAFSADTFRVTLPLFDQGERGLAFWGSTERMELDVLVGLDPDQPPSTSLILGRVDDVEVDLGQRSVTLAGRDFTSDLIEARTTEKWPNRKASEIARDLAGRHGLEAEVTDTSALVGTYYRTEHARLTDETTEWNLLTYLAEQEGFDCWVRGRRLYFGPPPRIGSARRWVMRYTPAGTGDDRMAHAQAPAGQILLRRNLTLARGIVVKVVSWNARQKRAFTLIRRSQGAGRNSSGQFSEGATHIFRVPGLTEEQARREADRRHAELSRHERTIELSDVPGDPDIDCSTMLVVEGAGAGWDQEYHLVEIERYLAQGGGFSMRLRARNTEPTSSASL